ncbi:quinone oxidoreductase family protein [Neobacillus dielmonensis]|uniref:quinone oxidoreductase family protein n=1 Tax=Neobacillus dielmonensis TaxID=1347369 RepID=UPI0005A764E6|nr:zinc-binding dehydrogenase [Neobacillus dielmonensis]
MKALVHYGKTGLEGLRLKEIQSVLLKDNEVRIKVKVAGLNHRDLFTLQQHDPNGEPLIIGSDAAGVITEVGSKVTKFKVNDEVMIYPAVGWDRKSDAPDDDFKILGNPINGTFAEEVIAAETHIALKPKSYSWEEAGVLSLAALTAYRALFSRGEVKKGDKVLIPGIGGGAASFLLQFAKAAGAHVTVTSRSKEKLAAALELGADQGLVTDEDWSTALNGDKFDIVIESVGAATFQKSLDSLRKGGTMVMFGSSTGDVVDFNLRGFFYGQFNLKGTTMGSFEEYQEMLQFVEAHQIHPIVDKVFDVEGFEEAFRYLENAKQQGKIGIRFAD